MDKNRLHGYCVGDVVSGSVLGVFPFGMYIEIDSGGKGYIPRRELSLSGDVDLRESLSVGQAVRAVVIGVTTGGTMRGIGSKRTKLYAKLGFNLFLKGPPPTTQYAT